MNYSTISKNTFLKGIDGVTEGEKITKQKAYDMDLYAAQFKAQRQLTDAISGEQKGKFYTNKEILKIVQKKIDAVVKTMSEKPTISDAQIEQMARKEYPVGVTGVSLNKDKTAKLLRETWTKGAKAIRDRK